jgi:glycosyltransferase involved in cell wall biosynthesis
MATACWDFPIYSQTFVYQELTQLIEYGFDLRFLYFHLGSREQLPVQFTPLWKARRRVILHPAVCQRAFAYFQKRMPEKVDSLASILCDASGMSFQELHRHHHFMQAFTFARAVEAYSPDYLHSYFFYEGTLFGFIASYLLDIPRGVSCYADHLLKDYALKLVPLHIEQCHIIIATSERIKQELMLIAPSVDPDCIIVKPNAINADQFPPVSCKEPEEGEPYRLVCVGRVEPKKGLLYLVDAVDCLRRQGLNIVLHLIGGVDNNMTSQEYAQVLQKRVGELKLGEIVYLEGRRSESEITAVFRHSHLFVAPFVETPSGDKDGIPTSLLEAMASGLPVVATDAGSICEVIDNGQNGMLVPQRDADALASAVANLIGDSERRARLGKNAAIKIREEFDVKVCEQIFHDRLLQILNVREDEA